MSAPKSRAQRLSWFKSLISALPAPGYWTLTATWRPSCQTARCTWPMEAAAAGWFVELGEARPPLLGHVAREHRVNSPGRHRRRGFLQPGQGRPVRFGDLRGQRGLEYRQRLPELHRAALELAKDPEDLICRPLLDFPGHQLSWPAAQALAGSQRGPACEPDRQPRQPGRTGDTMAGQIAHDPILRYAAIMHHSDRMHRSDRQLHPARRYRADTPYIRRHPVSRSRTGLRQPPSPDRIRAGVSTAGTARRHGCVSTQGRKGWPARPARSHHPGAFCPGRRAGVLDADPGALSPAWAARRIAGVS